jgi:hypothetical protein
VEFTVVFVRPIGGKQLLGSAGRHTVITDRKTDDGGTDAGCTSGELLLLAMGSCATGSIRKAFAARGKAIDDMRVEVALSPPKTPGARDAILITVYLPQSVLAAGTDPIVDAAVSGGVVSRIALGSEIDVRCRPLDDFPSSS